MVSRSSVFIAAMALATRAAAQATLQVLAVQDLSLDDTFVFKPNSLVAEVGDTIEFHFAPTGFLPSNHSVAQGTFDSGCEPLPGGFFSGNVEAPPESEEDPLGEAPKVFRVRVNTTDPIVFYCTTGQHCTRGMYGVINPTDRQNFDTYKALITSNGPAVAPDTVRGGQLVNTTGVATPAPVAAGLKLTGSMAFVLAGVAVNMLLL